MRLSKTASESTLERLKRERIMTTISIRIPEDVIEDLKEVAPAVGFSGYQPLIRAYIGQGLRKDLERIQGSPIQLLTESLRRRGLDEEVISTVIQESGLVSPQARSRSPEHPLAETR